MTDTVKSILMRVPVTMNIGPVPNDIQSHSQNFTFALANIKKVFADKGLPVELEGEQAIASYSVDNEIKSFTHRGDQLEVRHFQIARAGDNHALEISTDGGVVFTEIATFKDYDIADAFGRAWADGRAEQPA